MLAYRPLASGRPNHCDGRGIVSPVSALSGKEPSPVTQEPWYQRMVPAFLRRDRMAGQAVRFVLVGVMNTAVDLVAFYLLSLIPGMPEVAAKAFSYVLGICNSFVWNKYWTFSARGSGRGWREFGVFFAVNIPPLIVNVVAFTLLGLWIDSGTWSVRMGKAFVAAVISVAWNFLGSRYLAFRHTALKKGPDE
jgi:putative flippase GtrA